MIVLSYRASCYAVLSFTAPIKEKIYMWIGYISDQTAVAAGAFAGGEFTSVVRITTGENVRGLGIKRITRWEHEHPIESIF